MSNVVDEDVWDKHAQIRAETEARYCKLCRGSGFNLAEPLICKNCHGTRFRGEGNCHKCTISQAATGFVYRLCPVCMPQERVMAILDHNAGVLDNPVTRPVPSRHEHGPRDVQCDALSDMRKARANRALAAVAKPIQL